MEKQIRHALSLSLFLAENVLCWFKWLLVLKSLLGLLSMFPACCVCDCAAGRLCEDRGGGGRSHKSYYNYSGKIERENRRFLSFAAKGEKQKTREKWNRERAETKK